MTNSSVDPSVWACGMLNGRRVLVTGGTGSIGGAVAACFRDAGATVHATGPTEDECKRAKASDTSSSINFDLLDVRSNEAVKNFIGSLDDLHVVVNCAGIIRRGEERDPEVFDSVVDINLNGTMRVCEAALDKLSASGGCIINIASMLSFLAVDWCQATQPPRVALRNSQSPSRSLMHPEACASTRSRPVGSRRPSPRRYRMILPVPVPFSPALRWDGGARRRTCRALHSFWQGHTRPS